MSWRQQRDRIDARLAAFVGRDPGRRRALRLLTTGVALVFVLAAIVSLSTQEWGFAASWVVIAAALIAGNHRYLSPRRLSTSQPYVATHARDESGRRHTSQRA